jgi:hypothetical protein
VSAIDSEGRTIWIADAHRDDGKRFIVHADEKLTAFVELESAMRAFICARFGMIVREGPLSPALELSRRIADPGVT